MRGRVDKVIYHRPNQFPNAVAKIMESGAFRIVFRDQRRLVQKSGSKDVQVHFPDGRKEDVLDLDTLGRFNEVRNFLCNVESIWESQIGRFPLSFSLSKEPSIPSPRNTCSEVRLPLAMRNSQTQSLVTHQSAPATFASRAKISLESTKGLHEQMRYKMYIRNFRIRMVKCVALNHPTVGIYECQAFQSPGSSIAHIMELQNKEGKENGVGRIWLDAIYLGYEFPWKAMDESGTVDYVHILQERFECRLDQKDAELYDELMQIRLNNCEKHLAAVWGNRDAFTIEQLDEMLNDFKKELSEYEYDNEEEAAREELGKIYMKHLSAMFYAEKEKKLKAAREARSPPQPREIVQPDRSLPPPAEEMEISTSAQPAPENVEPVPVPVKKIEQPVPTTVEKMEVDEVETKPLDPVPEPPVIVTDAKRPRGRPPKKDASTPTREESPLHVEAKSPVRAEKTRRGSTRSDATPSPNTPGTSEKDIVDSPAGRVRGARRPVAVDSPLAKTTVRTSAGADVRETKESGRDGDGVKSRQSADALSRVSRAAAADDSGGKGAQTAVSVQMPLTGSDGESIPSRKSSRADRRSAAAAAAASTAVHSTPTSSQGLTTAVQTGEIKWEPEDMIVVGWPLSDAKMSLPSTSAYVVKTEQLLQRTEHVTCNQTSRLVSWDDVLNGSYEKKTSDSWKVQDPRLQMWDVCYCNFSDDALQAAREQALVHNHPETSNSFSLVASPPKRVRKEEKPSSATLTPKGRMMSAWNSLQEHRHSAVFLHPVTDRDAPGYSRLVYCPVDLTTVKREIDGGAITNPFVLMEKCVAF
ncbi:unnamed protein product [Nippostrongylus brasiliensis]|uniref:Brd8 (inferred by orthology to a D. melanogaster protein) n=1 Tax=Nippostrongylus brasiliensis TaxID=27835 RepID=A0A0N4XE09_NIPBR|nr:unnamed protein product [Nippostrongylus brasiliensis]